MRKKRKPIKKSNNLWGATTTSRDWGFIPIPGKGGKTLNCELKEEKNNA